MSIISNDKILGVHQGVSYGQFDRINELNSRLSERHFPDSPLEPNFDPRPVPTKYSLFPIINRRAPVRESAIPYIGYNVNVNFNPGSSKAPRSGNNVDLETVLRNQHFALQHGADQNVYIPQSNSDLYKTSVVSRPSEQPYPLLFSNMQFSSSPHPNVANSIIGRDDFCNHTRTQLRNSN